MSDDDGVALDEMQSFACDIDLIDSDGEGEALRWPQRVDIDSDADDSCGGCGTTDDQGAPSEVEQRDDYQGIDGVARALQSGVAMPSRVDAMMSIEYWRALCPQLHVSDPEFARKTVRAVFNYVNDPDTVDALRASMARDGYVTMSAGEAVSLSSICSICASSTRSLRYSR